MIQVIDPNALVEARIGRDQAAANTGFFGKVAAGSLVAGFLLFLMGGTLANVGGAVAAFGVLMLFNARVDLWIYERALRFGQQPYEHRLTLSTDVVETKATKLHDDPADRVDVWRNEVFKWMRNSMTGKVALRVDDLGHHFYFKNFEDLALFKLWV